MNLYDVLGFLTGAICVLLLVFKSVWNWPFAILNAGVFLVSFAIAGLYGDAGLQLVFIGISVYGWIFWLRGGEAQHEAPIGRLSWRGHVATLAFVAAATWALASVLQTWLHSSVPVWDGLTTSLSLGAIVLQSRKILDNWYYWILADVIYVPLYVAKGLPLTGLLYVIFIPMCIAGIVTWNRTLATTQR